MKLSTENLVKSYKNRRVVNGVSVEVNQGEIVIRLLMLSRCGNTLRHVNVAVL